MKKYDLIIFDLIDTLAYCKGLSDVEAELIQTLGEEAVDIFIDSGNIDKLRSVDEAIKKFQASVALSPKQEELVRRWLSWPETYLYEDVPVTLQFLKSEGYLVGIISNSPPTTQDQLLDLGITQYIDAVVFSFEVHLRKPEKEIFLNLLEQVNVEPTQALMIGDSIKNDVNGARAVGIDALLLDRSNTIDFDPKITNLSQLKEFLTT